MVVAYQLSFRDIPRRSRRATTFDDGGDEAAVAPKRLLLQMKVDHEGKGKSQPLGPKKPWKGRGWSNRQTVQPKSRKLIFDQGYGRSRSFKIDMSRCWHSPTDLGITRFQMRTTRIAVWCFTKTWTAGNIPRFFFQKA